jgi:NAD(P)-dependent dehydrogenase (short-subunit alcohol dehydrogenase family)
MNEGPLDALFITGGTWEQGAFTDAYDFAACSDEDIARVVDINLVAPIRLAQAFLPALCGAESPRIIVIGAVSARFREVANSGSKAGLLGACAALRECLRPHRIGVTLVNPGNVATPEVVGDVAAGTFPADSVIPMEDLLAVLDCVLSLSRRTVPTVIELPAMGTTGA